MTTTSSRLLSLLALLQARRHWTGDELADRLEVSRRSVRRDVERLRELGYPVESVRGPAGGYRLHAGAAMPPLLLDDEEAIAIAVGLRTAARTAVLGIEETSLRALVKLEQVLPAHLRRRVSALGAATRTLPEAEATVDAHHLTLIAAACRDAERIRFAYEDRDGARSRRDVEPHSLVNLGRRWYLLAWDRDRADWRTFRLDRLTRPAATGLRFEPREPPAKDVARYVQRRLAARPYRYEARIAIAAPLADVRKRVPPSWGTLERIDERSCEYRTGDDDLDWLALRVAMIGFEVEVREPPELRAELGRLAERLTRAAG